MKSTKKQRLDGAKRTAKADAKKREQGLVPRKHWIHSSNEEEFKRIADKLKDPS